MQIATRAGLIKPSPTITVSSRAAELRAQGVDVIGLGAGEPDFPTPAHIKDAAIAAIETNQTRYTAVDGTAELKKAIIAKFHDDNDLDYSPDQILVSSGCKQSIYNLMQATLNHDDEVIIPAPYWVSYPDMALLAEAKPVIVNTSVDNGFKITADELQSAITSKTKLFILNSPSNPTGVAYNKDELESLAKVLLDHPHVMICSDDIYEKIIWNDSGFDNLVTVCDQLYDRTFVFNGVSKAYAMTGWRIGYVAGAAQVIKQMKKIQSQSTSNPCSISQAAACAALLGSQQAVADMVKVFKHRHDMVVSELNSMTGVTCLPGDGAFYAFANFSEAMVRLGFDDDVAFAEALLNEAKVALVPGSAFGVAKHLRISYATSDELLSKALDRINTFLS